MGEKDWDTCRSWKRSQKCMRMWKLKFKNCNKVTRYFANKIWTVYPKNQEKVICFAKNRPKFNQIIFDSVFWKYFQGQENVFMTFLWKIITKIIVIKSKCGNPLIALPYDHFLSYFWLPNIFLIIFYRNVNFFEKLFFPLVFCAFCIVFILFFVHIFVFLVNCIFNKNTYIWFCLWLNLQIFQEMLIWTW